MVNILGANGGSNLLDSALFGVFQTLSSTYSIGNASLIQKSGATVFNYRGSSASERLAVRNYNYALTKQKVADGKGVSAFSSVPPSIVPQTTDQVIKDLQKQIDDLKKQINGETTSDGTTPSSVDGLFRQRDNSQQQNYSITATTSVAQEKPRSGTSTYGNELVFSVSRTGKTSVASSVSFRLVEHLSTVTASDFTLYKNDDDQFTNPAKDPVTDLRPSGTVNFNAGETQKNFTVYIRNDQELETTDETLSVGLYNTLTGSYIASATGLVAADENKDIDGVSTKLSYTDPLGEQKTYSDTSGYLTLDSLERADWSAFIAGQLTGDERVRVRIEYTYGIADEDDFNNFDPAATTMTATQDFFFSKNPNFIATSIDPLTGKILSQGDLSLATTDLQAAFAALTGNQDLKVDFMINEVFNVDDKGMDTTAFVNNNFWDPADSVSVVVSENTKYTLETPAALTTREGEEYEVVVTRDKAYTDADVTIMLSDVGGSGFGNPTDDIDGGADHTLMFAIGEYSATLTLKVTDDTDPEADETFNVLLDTVTITMTASLTPTPTITAYIDTSMNSFDAMIEMSDTAGGGDLYEITNTPAPNTFDETASPSFSFDIMRNTSINNGAIDFRLSAGAARGFDFNDIETIEITNLAGTTTINVANAGDLTQTASFAVGEDNVTVMITLRDDTNVEREEDFNINLIPSSTASLGANPSYAGSILTSDVTDSMYSVVTPAATSVNEGGNLEIVVRRDYAGETADVTIDLAGTGANPANMDDFDGMMSSFTLSFNARDLEATLTLMIFDDTFTESQEDFDVTISMVSSPGGTIMHAIDTTANSFSASINPSDVANTYELTSVPPSTNLDEGMDYNFEVSRTNFATGAVNEVFIDIIDTGGAGDIDGSDFTVTGATLETTGVPPNTIRYKVTFTGTSPTADIMITVNDDNNDEPNDDFEIRLAVSDPTTLVSGPSFSGMIMNDDVGNTVFSVSSSTTAPSNPVTEGTEFEFVIMRDATTGDTVNFQFAAVGAAAFDAMDIDLSAATATGGTVTPNAGGLSGTFMFTGTATTATITVMANVDLTALETNEDFTLSLSAPTAATMSFVDTTQSMIDGSITDNPAISISAPTSVDEGGTLEVEITRTDTSIDSIDLALLASTGSTFTRADLSGVSATGGTVTGGIIPPTGNLNFMFTGTGLTATLTFTTNDDATVENAEDFEINLAASATGTSGTIFMGNSGPITINDNESEFTALIQTVTTMVATTTLREGNSYEIVVMRTGGGAGTVTVDLASTTGFSNADFNIVGGSNVLNFGTGDTEQTLRFSLVDSDGVENENFQIMLTATPTSGTGTWTDVTPTTSYTVDESPTTFVISNRPASVAEGGTYEIVISRTDTLIDDVNINIDASTGSSFTRANDLLRTFDVTGGSFTGIGMFLPTTGDLMFTFNTGVTDATITLHTNDDALVEGDESFDISLVLPAGSRADIDTARMSQTVTINDNEAGFAYEVHDSVTMMPVAGTTLSEGDTYEIVITRTGDTTSSGTLDVDLASATGFSAADFMFTGSNTLTFNAGDTMQTLTVSLTKSDGVETEDFQVMLSMFTASSGTWTDLSTASTFTVMDTVTNFELSAPTTSLTEGGPVEIVITRSDTSADSVEISLAASAGSAFTRADLSGLSATGGSVTGGAIPATGNLNFMFTGTDLMATLTLNTDDDADVESAESFDVALVAPAAGFGGLGAASMASININDNDASFTTEIHDSVTMMAITGTTLTEGNTYEIVVMRTGDTSSSGTVDVDFSSATGFSGADYLFTFGSNMITFNAGDTAQTLQFFLQKSDGAETEDFQVMLSMLTASAGTWSDASPTSTFTVMDAVTNFELSAPTTSFTEGGPIEIVLTRSDTSASSVDISLAASAGSTFSRSDLSGLSVTGGSVTGGVIPATGNLNFMFTGLNLMATLTLTTDDDTNVESAESFDIALVAPTAGIGGLGAASMASITINDNDASFTTQIHDSATMMAIGGTTLTEGNTYEIIVMRTGDTTSSGTVDVDLSSVTGFSAADYTLTGSNTLTFNAGDTAQTLTVSLAKSDGAETESFQVMLSMFTASAGTWSDASPTSTFTVMDAVTTFELNAPTTSIMEGGPVEIVITRSDTSADSVDISLAAGAGSSFTRADLSGLSVTGGSVTGGTIPPTGNINFMFTGTDLMATLTLTTNDDANAESAESFDVALVAPTAGVGDLGAASMASITINDNDASFTTEIHDSASMMAIAGTTLTEGNTYEIIVMRTGDTTSSGTVDVDLSSVTGFSAADYTLTGSNTLTFNAGDTAQTLTVSLAKSDGAETESFQVMLSMLTASAGTWSDASPTSTFTVMDAVTTFELSAPTTSLMEGDPVEIVITRSDASADSVDISLGASAGSSFTRADLSGLSVTGGSVTGGTIPPTGNINFMFTGTGLTATLTLTTNDDANAENPESFDVALVAPTAGVGDLGATSMASITINDNDVEFTAEVHDSTMNPLVGTDLNEGDTYEIVVMRTGDTSSSGTVDISLDAITGAANMFSAADYTSTMTPLSLTFAAGITSQTLTITLADTDGTENEEFQIMLDAMLATGAGITWTDVDPAATFSVLDM